jgi:pyruvate kinase
MGSMIGTDSIIFRAIEMAKGWGWVDTGDRVVALHGQLEARPGSTNLVRVVTCM